MTKKQLIQTIKENQEKQNAISLEIVEFIKTKQRELIPLTQNIKLVQDQLWHKYHDDNQYDYPNKEWDLLYDMSQSGKIFGYMLTADEINAIMDLN